MRHRSFLSILMAWQYLPEALIIGLGEQQCHSVDELFLTVTATFSLVNSKAFLVPHHVFYRDFPINLCWNLSEFWIH